MAFKWGLLTNHLVSGVILQVVCGWFTNPSEKYAQVKLDHIHDRIGVKIKNYLKPPPRPALKLTASLPLKIGGWKILDFPFRGVEKAYFQSFGAACFREGKLSENTSRLLT